MYRLYFGICLITIVHSNICISQESPISLRSEIQGGLNIYGLMDDEIIDSYLNPADFNIDEVNLYCGGSFDLDNSNPTKYIYSPFNNFHIYLLSKYKGLN